MLQHVHISSWDSQDYHKCKLNILEGCLFFSNPGTNIQIQIQIQKNTEKNTIKIEIKYKYKYKLIISAQGCLFLSNPGVELAKCVSC